MTRSRTHNRPSMPRSIVRRDERPTRRMFGVDLPRLAHLAVVSLLVLLFVLPLAWLLLSSFKGATEFAAVPPTYLPQDPTIENYERLQQANIWIYARNSIVAAVGTVVLTTIVSACAGYGFARFDFRGRSVLLVLVLMSLLVPFQSVTPALYTLLDAASLTNSLIGLVLVYTTFALPFGVLAMRASFAAIPTELEEAAIVDGLNPLQVLVRVMFPLAVPGAATVALYAFFNAWNEFLAALIFNNRQDSFTLPVALANIQAGAAGTLNWGVLETGAVVAAVPCVAVFLVLQRYYTAGLTAGAIKG